MVIEVESRRLAIDGSEEVGGVVAVSCAGGC